jgi:hypothetical protein
VRFTGGGFHPTYDIKRASGNPLEQGVSYRRLGDRYLVRRWASCSLQQAVRIAACAHRPIVSRRVSRMAFRSRDPLLSLNVDWLLDVHGLQFRGLDDLVQAGQ